MSSGYSASPKTGIGSSAAAEITSSVAIRTSTRPVSSAGLIVSSERATTLPVTEITLSDRSFSTSPNIGESVSITHCVTP